ATPGDYDGAVFTSLMTTASQQGETVNLDLRVGVRVHLRVKGEIHPSVRVDDVKVERLNPWWNPLPGDVRLSFRATNTGNVRVTAKAVADVRANYILRKANKTAQREVYTPELLPGSTVVFSIDEPELVGAWAQGPTIAGIWQFGRQTYSVYLVNGKVPNSDARPETAIGTITVWVIPWVPLIVAVLLLALLLRGVYRIVFRRRIEERFERKIARRRAKGRVRYADDPDESAEVAAVVAAAKPAKKVKPAKVDTVTSQVQPVLPGKTKKAGKAGKKGKTAKAGKTDPVATVAEPFDWSSSAPLGDTADLINGSVSPPENPTDQAEGSV
ncbi:MAG: hypothetical protein FWG16_07725, partial [Micrococcales bacterium]|nr:hypothetical protein [Micrococcales bacterium]